MNHQSDVIVYNTLRIKILTRKSLGETRSLLQPRNYQKAIYSNETSKDKLSEAYNRQSIIVNQIHDKLHENLYMSTCSFNWNNESG